MRHSPMDPRDMLDRMRGTKQRARKLRGVVTGVGLGFAAMGAALCALPTGGLVTIVGAVTAGLGLVAVAAVRVVAPISKVTWRAWLLGWWRSRDAQRRAVNHHGHPSARARRSATNKATWAAQRAAR